MSLSGKEGGREELVRLHLVMGDAGSSGDQILRETCKIILNTV